MYDSNCNVITRDIHEAMCTYHNSAYFAQSDPLRGKTPQDHSTQVLSRSSSITSKIRHPPITTISRQCQLSLAVAVALLPPNLRGRRSCQNKSSTPDDRHHAPLFASSTPRVRNSSQFPCLVSCSANLTAVTFSLHAARGRKRGYPTEFTG